MTDYKINSQQILLLLGHFERFIKSRLESSRQIQELCGALSRELKADPVAAITGIFRDICNNPQQEQEYSSCQQTASIPALCGAWESIRPKRLLIVYMHKEGISAALTRSIFLGSRTEIILLQGCNTGSCFALEDNSKKEFFLKYESKTDTLTLNGKIQFRRICHMLEAGK